MTYTHQVKLDCAEQVIHQNKFVFTLMENGCYTIIAKDTAGNESTAPVTVTIDTPPKPMSSPLAPTEACRFHRHKRWRSAKSPWWLAYTNQAYVYSLIKPCLLPVLKLGSYKIRKEALIRFLEENEGKDLTDPNKFSALRR